ncbi:N-acetylglucosamine-6-phosphate deacetylase [Niabella yanshanensis]|uniref:N-acetylglucosamine-6-phosphate deacetylase n=1 Tax=Niabella yanshanensis TaxID=577386 RepID=A0ABZ0W6S1_9BACT|nr:N-acetylglucosamine-6-phosphate deacetylase [Niabella yanshanensis]WQD37232.1 N-acetylglucosamine-6-phosphate deacetylase [Niabella yanshanensis]
MQQAIINATIFTGSEIVKDASILIENGKIIKIDASMPDGVQIIDAAGKNIAPAFIDIQPNGGYDLYFSKELSDASLQDMYQASIDHGTGYILPTLISSGFETILKGIETVKNFMQQQPGVLGMHLEGPFINVDKRGAHPATIIRKPTDEELKQIIAAGKEVIKIITIAPECFTDDQLQLLLDSGINIAIGHTAVTYEQAQYYFSKGIQLVTHLYNAMNQMGHRECGLVGAIFDNENVYAPVILDGGHCHYAAARVAYKQKGDKLILLSDAAFLGRRKQVFDWENLSIKMVDGYYRDGAGNLGGAAISMIDAVKNAMVHLHVTLQEAIEMATGRVAKAIKMDGRIGFIQPGYDARFVLFDNELSSVEFLAG